MPKIPQSQLRTTTNYRAPTPRAPKFDQGLGGTLMQASDSLANIGMKLYQQKIDQEATAYTIGQGTKVSGDWASYATQVQKQYGKSASNTLDLLESRMDESISSSIANAPTGVAANAVRNSMLRMKDMELAKYRGIQEQAFQEETMHNLTESLTVLSSKVQENFVDYATLATEGITQIKNLQSSGLLSPYEAQIKMEEFSDSVATNATTGWFMTLGDDDKLNQLEFIRNGDISDSEVNKVLHRLDPTQRDQIASDLLSDYTTLVSAQNQRVNTKLAATAKKVKLRKGAFWDSRSSYEDKTDIYNALLETGQLTADETRTMQDHLSGKSTNDDINIVSMAEIAITNGGITSLEQLHKVFKSGISAETTSKLNTLISQQQDRRYTDAADHIKASLGFSPDAYAPESISRTKKLQALSKLSKEYNDNPGTDLFKFAKEIVYEFHETDIKQIELSIGAINESIDNYTKLIAMKGISDSDKEQYLTKIDKLRRQLNYQQTDLNNLLGVQ